MEYILLYSNDFSYFVVSLFNTVLNDYDHDSAIHAV